MVRHIAIVSVVGLMAGGFFFWFDGKHPFFRFPGRPGWSKPPTGQSTPPVPTNNASQPTTNIVAGIPSVLVSGQVTNQVISLLKPGDLVFAFSMRDMSGAPITPSSQKFQQALNILNGIKIGRAHV